MNSSLKQTTSSKGKIESNEESGWTVYFEDFLANKNREYSECSSGFGRSSLVSDAASCAAWKLSEINRVAQNSSEVKPQKSYKKLNFKKRRTRIADDDDDDALEDTASSPVNSPKVSDLKDLDMNAMKKHEHLDSSQGNTTGHCSEQQADEINELGFIGREIEYTELKKRGLCLVPLSMLVNYLG